MNTDYTNQVESPLDKLYTVSKFIKRHNDFLTEGGLRFQVFNEEQNGLAESGAIIRVGRRVLINEVKYFKWIYVGQKGREDTK